MNKKKLIILITILIIILAVILLATLNIKKIDKTANTPGDSANSMASEQSNAPVSQTSITVSPLSVMPGSPEAPKQEVVAENNIPTNAIKLMVSDAGFSPKEFTVSAGQKVSLAITAKGTGPHVFIFPNASLMALTMMVTGDETKVIDFTAPAAGSYDFRDDIPGFRNNTGTMIVK